MTYFFYIADKINRAATLSAWASIYPKGKKAFYVIKELSGHEADPTTYEEFITFDTQITEDGIVAPSRTTIKKRASALYETAKKTIDQEPEIQDIFQRAMIEHDIDLQNEIRQDLFQSTASKAQKQLGKYTHFLHQTERLFKEFITLENIQKRIQSTPEQGLEELLRTLKEKVYLDIWQDNPETIKYNIKHRMKQWKSEHGKPITHQKNTPESVNQNALKTVEDHTSSAHAQIKNAEHNIESHKKKHSTLAQNIKDTTKELSWKTDRLKYLKRRLKTPEGKKNRLVKGIESLNLDIDLEGLKTPIKLHNIIVATPQKVAQKTNNAEQSATPLAKNTRLADLENLRDTDGLTDATKQKINTAIATEIKANALQNELTKHRNHNTALNQELKNLQKEYTDVVDLISGLEKLKEDIPKSTTALQNIWDKHKDSAPKRTADKQYPPLENLQEWVEENFSERLYVDPKVYKTIALPKFKFTKPEYVNIIQQSIELLANEYWEHRVSGEKPDHERNTLREKFMNKVKNQMGMIYGGSISDTRYTSHPDYYVHYQNHDIHLGKKLKKGKGRHNQHGTTFHMYFGWDDIDKKVIIGGATPGHGACSIN